MPGRPALFATTKHFLDDLGLTSLDQLPPLQQVEKGDMQGSALLEMQGLEVELQEHLDQTAIDFAGADAATAEVATEPSAEAVTTEVVIEAVEIESVAVESVEAEVADAEEVETVAAEQAEGASDTEDTATTPTELNTQETEAAISTDAAAPDLTVVDDPSKHNQELNNESPNEK